MENKIALLMGLLWLSLLQGCSSPKSLAEVDQYFEEDDYTNWVQDEVYFEVMRAKYKGSLGHQLPATYARNGSIAEVSPIETTQGLSANDGVIAATMFVDAVTPLNVLTTLNIMNSDSPSFGSVEHRMMMTTKYSVELMSKNSIFYVSELSENDLPEVEPGLSPHHTLHKRVKARFIDIREWYLANVPNCQFDGYIPEEDGYIGAFSYIRPLQQYLEAVKCESQDGDFKITSNMFVYYEGEQVKIAQLLTVSDLVNFEQVDEQALYESPYWQSMMIACRDCNSNLDRTVVIRSKKQENDWRMEYPKGSIYPSETATK